MTKHGALLVLILVCVRIQTHSLEIRRKVTQFRDSEFRDGTSQRPTTLQGDSASGRKRRLGGSQFIGNIEKSTFAGSSVKLGSSPGFRRYNRNPEWDPTSIEQDPYWLEEPEVPRLGSELSPTPGDTNAASGDQAKDSLESPLHANRNRIRTTEAWPNRSHSQQDKRLEGHTKFDESRELNDQTRNKPSGENIRKNGEDKPAVYKRVIPYRIKNGEKTETFMIETINFDPKSINKLEIIDRQEFIANENGLDAIANSPRYSRDARPTTPNTPATASVLIPPTHENDGNRSDTSEKQQSQIDPSVPPDKRLGLHNRSPYIADSRPLSPPSTTDPRSENNTSIFSKPQPNVMKRVVDSQRQSHRHPLRNDASVEPNHFPNFVETQTEPNSDRSRVTIGQEMSPRPEPTVESEPISKEYLPQVHLGDTHVFDKEVLFNELESSAEPEIAEPEEGILSNNFTKTLPSEHEQVANRSQEYSPQFVPEPSEEVIPEHEISTGEGSEPHTEPETENQPKHPTNRGDVTADIVYSEPNPKWKAAKREWGPAWELHTYGTGVVFASIALYSLVSMIRLSTLKDQGYFIALNGMMFIMGLVRAIYLIVDGYNSNGTFPLVFAYFLYSLGSPCLTSAFSILFLALLQSTQMRYLPDRIQSPKLLLGVIIFHFSLSISTDIVTGLLANSRVMLIICQVITVLWSFALFFGYIFLFTRLHRYSLRREKELLRQSFVRSQDSPSSKPRKTLTRAVKITLATAFCGLVGASLQLYGMFGVYYVYGTSPPYPWAWWGFMFSIRLTEIGMCATMCYVATQPFRFNADITEKQGFIWQVLYFASCPRLWDKKSKSDATTQWTDFHALSYKEQQTLNSLKSSIATRPLTIGSQPLNSAIMTTYTNATIPSSPSPSTSANTSTSRTGRPASLLISENGFIRFRRDGDTDGEPVMLSSTDDDLGGNLNDYIDRTFPVYYTTLNDLQSDRKETMKDGAHAITRMHGSGVRSDSEQEYLTDSDQLSPLGSRPPMTGNSTPLTPKSLCSQGGLSMFSFKPPSSIHLRDSIENALDLNFSLRTPASWTPERMLSPARHRAHSWSSDDLHQFPQYGATDKTALNSRQAWYYYTHNRRRHSNSGLSSSFSSLKDNNGNQTLLAGEHDSTAVSDINSICDAINKLNAQSQDSMGSVVDV